MLGERPSFPLAHTTFGRVPHVDLAKGSGDSGAETTMWKTLSTLAQSDQDAGDMATDLARATVRAMVAATSGSYLVLLLFLVCTATDEFSMRMWFLMPALATTCLLTLRLLPGHLLSAHALWHARPLVPIWQPLSLRERASAKDMSAMPNPMAFGS